MGQRRILYDSSSYIFRVLSYTEYRIYYQFLRISFYCFYQILHNKSRNFRSRYLLVPVLVGTIRMEFDGNFLSTIGNPLLIYAGNGDLSDLIIGVKSSQVK